MFVKVAIPRVVSTVADFYQRHIDINCGHRLGSIMWMSIMEMLKDMFAVRHSAV